MPCIRSPRVTCAGAKQEPLLAASRYIVSFGWGKQHFAVNRAGFIDENSGLKCDIVHIIESVLVDNRN